MIPVSTKMPYQDVREISLRLEKSQGRCKSKRGGYPEVVCAAKMCFVESTMLVSPLDKQNLLC